MKSAQIAGANLEGQLETVFVAKFEPVYPRIVGISYLNRLNGPAEVQISVTAPFGEARLEMSEDLRIWSVADAPALSGESNISLPMNSSAKFFRVTSLPAP